MSGTEEGIPEYAAETAEAERVKNAVVVRDDAVQCEGGLRNGNDEADCEREKRRRERQVRDGYASRFGASQS